MSSKKKLTKNEVRDRLLKNVDWYYSFIDNWKQYREAERKYKEAESWCNRNGHSDVFDNVKEHKNTGEVWGNEQVELIDWSI